MPSATGRHHGATGVLAEQARKAAARSDGGTLTAMATGEPAGIVPTRRAVTRSAAKRRPKFVF